jgi:adenine-specific DNA-methyltransferase
MSHKWVPASSTVFTPSALAAAMVRAARDHRGCQWLDPCVGGGAFVAEMSALGVPPERVRALDLSPSPCECDDLATTERGVDFVEWATRHACSVDRVVMNPPFAALSRIRGTPLARALRVMLADGRPLPLGANYWCAFVLRAIDCLRPGGVLVAVLPAAWDFARYADRVRASVIQAFGDIFIIRSARPLFSTVQEGSVVVVARDCRKQPAAVRRIEVDDLNGVIRALDDLAADRVPPGALVVRSIRTSTHARARLDEIVDIRIGAVTGDASYFLLTENERLEFGLPKVAVRPVLSRSKHLTAAFVTEKDWARLRDEGARVWLFRPTRGR